MVLKGNKGEWTELYTLLYLAVNKEIPQSDWLLSPVSETINFNQVYFPTRTGTLQFHEENGTLTVNNKLKETTKTITTAEVRAFLPLILTGILNGKGASFSISPAVDLAQKLGITSIKTSSQHKEDFSATLLNNPSTTEGFSIKSQMGQPATLLNASKHTNFVYSVTNLEKERINEINNIQGRSKIRLRLKEIQDQGAHLAFSHIDGPYLEQNMRSIDKELPETFAQMLIAYYSGQGSLFKQLLSHTYKDYVLPIKTFLQTAASNIPATTKWEATNLTSCQGFIVVKPDGQIVGFHGEHLSSFENYLLAHTKFETPSSGRHKFGTLFEENNQIWFKLNLQVRFLKGR